MPAWWEFLEKVLGVSWVLKAVWDMPGVGGMWVGKAVFGEGAFCTEARQCGQARLEARWRRALLQLAASALPGAVWAVWPLGGPWTCSPERALGFGCAWAGSSFCCENCGERGEPWEGSLQVVET